MKGRVLYNPKVLLLFRLFSIAAVVILSISSLHRMSIYGINFLFDTAVEAVGFTLNVVSTILFLYIAIFPYKFAITSIIAFLYSAYIILFEPDNIMGVFLYYYAVVSLYANGFFNRSKKIKNAIFIILLVLLVLTELRFGFSIYFRAFVEKLAYTFVFIVSAFFVHAYTINLFDAISENKTLNIQNYKELTKRDALWLIDILEKKKYHSIAIEYQMTVGAVKNRFKVIYNLLGVGDKQGFINKYLDYTICFGEEILKKGSEREP